MDIRKLQRAIVDGLEDVKAQNITVFNTEHLSSMFERVIIASGTSNRQTKALASSVRESVKSRGMQVMSTEGEDNGEWIIVDCGAAVAHIMQPAIRDYYHLEEIWGGKNVRMKVGEVKAGLVKASEPDKPARKTGKPARKTADQTPGKTAALAGGRAAPARAPAAKSQVRKAPSAPFSPAAAKKSSSRTAAVKRVVTKAPPRKTVAVARKAAPRKTAAR